MKKKNRLKNTRTLNISSRGGLLWIKSRLVGYLGLTKIHQESHYYEAFHCQLGPGIEADLATHGQIIKTN